MRTAALRRRCASSLLLTAGLVAQSPAIRASEAELLARIDAAFAAGDRRAFFACFAVDAATHALDAWQARWQALAPETGAIRRRSSVLEVEEAEGVRSLVVRVEYRDPTHAEFPVCTQEERWALGAGTDPLRIRLGVDHDAAFDRRLRANAGLWQCPPCAFQMQTPPGWLAVPTSALASLCLDAATFYHPRVDLALEVGVQVVAAAADAKAVLEGVLLAMGGPAANPAPDAPRRRPRSWCPAQFAATERPACIDAAQIVVELGEHRAVDARVVAFGRMAFVLATYGAPTVLRAHESEIERALAGFRLDTSVAPDVLVTRARAHHGGGAMFDDKGDFVHAELGIRVPLPHGWSHELLAVQERCGAIAWDPQTRSRIRIAALPPPRGFPRWSLLLADRALTRTAGAWLDTARDSGWSTSTEGRSRRTVLGTSSAGVCGIGVVQREDVFLVVQWEACSPACRKSIEAILGAIELR